MNRNTFYSLFLALLSVLMFLPGCTQDLSDQEHYDKARGYYSENKLSESIIELKNSLKKNPEHADARYLLGIVYLELQDADSAEKELRKAREYGVTSTSLTLSLAESLIAQQRPAEAVAELASVDSEDSGVIAEKNAILAKAHLGLGEYSEAKRNVENARQLAPGHLRVMLVSAQYYLVNKDIDTAWQTLNATVQAYPESSEAWLQLGKLAEHRTDSKTLMHAYQRVIEIEPGVRLTPRALNARFGLSVESLRLGDLAQAKKHAEMLYQANARHYLANYLLGAIAYRENDFKSALEHLQVSNSNNNEYLPTRLLLGAVHYALGNYNQAEAHLVQYNARVPGNIEASRLLGATYLRLGEPGKALGFFKGALVQNPDDTQLLALVGELAIRAGRLDLAQAYISKSRTLGSDAQQSQLHLASAYMASGDYAAAIAELERLDAESDTSDIASTVRLVFAYVQSDQADKALQKARAYLDKHPDDVRAHNMLGAVYMAMGRHTESHREFEAAFRLDNSDVTTHLNLARVAMAQNDVSQARNWLDKALARDDKNIMAMILMAQLSGREGEEGAMLDWLHRALAADAKALAPRLLLASHALKAGDFTTVQKYLDEILTLQPKNQFAHSLRVDSFLRQRDLDKAHVAAQAWISVLPESAEAYAKLGVIEYARKNTAEARKSLEMSLRLRPGFFPAIQTLASLELKEGRLQEALKLAAGVQKEQPESAFGYVLEGDIRMSQKEYQAAVRLYRQAHHLEQSALTTVKLAQALSQAGEPWAAISRPLIDWLDKHSEDDNARLQLANLARANGQLEVTLRSYAKILEHQPDNAVILNDYAWTLYELKKDPRAVSYAKRAYELKPELAVTLDTYGWILLQEGDVHEGLEMLRQAHAKLPGHPDVTYHFASGLAQAGQKAESRALLQKLLANHTAFASREAAVRLLDSL